MTIILTTGQIDCHRRIGRNMAICETAWVEIDALLDSHEALRAEVERLTTKLNRVRSYVNISSDWADGTALCMNPVAKLGMIESVLEDKP